MSAQTVSEIFDPSAWREVPGFEQSYFIEAYPWIGVRESRRIIGQHVLSEDDLMQSRRFDDDRGVREACDLHFALPRTDGFDDDDFVPCGVEDLRECRRGLGDPAHRPAC